MTQTYGRRFGIGRTTSPDGSRRTSRRHAGTLLGEALERRALRSVVNLSASVSPVVLRQINPRDQPHAVQVALIRPVTLAGYVTETAGVIPEVSFQVVDENGRDMPSGTITPQFVKGTTPGPPNLFFFSKRFGLNRVRLPGDGDGRKYTVYVTAQDAQSTSTVAIAVTTPPAAGK